MPSRPALEGCLAGWLLVALPGAAATAANDVPIAGLILVGPADAAGMAPVTGAPGASPGGSAVILVTRETGQVVVADAAPDGSFSSHVFAPPGVTILVKVDVAGGTADFIKAQSGAFGTNLAFLPGTMLALPMPPAGGSGTPFASAGLTGRNPEAPDQVPAVWRMEGLLVRRQLSPGGMLELTGRLAVRSPALAGAAGPFRVQVLLCMERLAGPDGSPYLAESALASTTLTPSELPIERPRQYAVLTQASLSLARVGAQLVEAGLALTARLPSDLPAGHYHPYLIFNFEGIPTEPAAGRRYIYLGPLRQPRDPFVYLPPLRVGSPLPPRIPWLLLGDTLIQGSRGVVAVEDRTGFALAPRVATATETLIVPAADAATGEAIPYSLEPFVPTLAIGDHGGSNEPPALPLRLPGGQMTARIVGPGGSQQVLGPFPFQQSLMQNAPMLDHGGAVISDLYRLSTLRDELELSFDQEGHYQIELEGWVEDLWGTVWQGGGTYHLHVARALSLDTSVLPGTLFEVGDTATSALVLHPPVPADIEVRYWFLPGSDPARRTERRITGRANRFGYFQVAGGGFVFNEPGEYRADIVASYLDPQGRLWMGARTWGGIVAPRASGILAHGRRGIVLGEHPAAQWFRRSDVGAPLSGPATHIPFPFHSGDVSWFEDHEHEAPFAHVSFQEAGAAVAELLESRCCSALGGPEFSFAERRAFGELPLFSSRPHGISLDLDPTKADLWAYSYRSVQRPLVRVREMIGEDFMIAPYWGLDEGYHRQHGVGTNGDLRNDFKLQFGAAVLRGAALDRPLYSIYGSLAVLIPRGDPAESRTFPPFQGNGGGPSGGPIMTLKGREIDLFWHPTAVRPGTILEIGNWVSFTGYFGPTLPCKLNLTVTSPSGKLRTLSGRANKIGYFYDPDLDFYADEPGEWKVGVHGFFDGITSAGQVTAPFPTGDVLGTADGVFSFYVVRRDAPALVVNKPEDSFVRPAEGAIPISVSNPAGLSQTEVKFTTVMPGFLLEQGQLPALTYSYDAPELAQEFPNLDLFDGDGKAGVDTITMSLLASGTDASGQPQYRARQILLQGEELFNLPQDPGPPCANTEETLCLNSGRFFLSMRWRDSQSGTGVGHAVPLTADSGYFWFFRPDNVEVLVKALNACSFPGNPNFWIFAAGLTNVETTLEVTDTRTGEVRFYENPLGKAFAPLQDTAAFPTCGAPAPAPLLAASSTPSPQPTPASRSFSSLGMTTGHPARIAAAATACTPSPTALCLAGGRFRVEATWKTAQGLSGQGQAVALTQDTGYFWFFRSDNVEVITKVLNACSFPGSPRFWTFAAGLTNVEVVLKVTDTQTGQVHEYENPLNRPFQPIQDTSAFATCP